MKREHNRRDGVVDADATGMIAGEELITQAETLLPLRNAFPGSDLHAALPPGHAGHQAIDQLHGELEKSRPDAHAIHAHLSVLRDLPELEATLANWWDDPKTQRVIANLGQIGL